MLRQITPELAEFVGIMIGDGNVSWYPKLKHFRVTISSNSETDYSYIIKRIKLLIEKLWKVKPEIYFQPNEKNVKCRFYSKTVAEQIIDLGIPKNKKTLKVKIPEKILSDKILTISCIRGIFDTDGSIFQKYIPYAQIGIRSCSNFLIKDLAHVLRKLKFNPSINKNHGYIFIHRQTEIKRFFKVIGSSNPKHIVRFVQWKKTGFVPRISDTTKLIMKYKGEIPFLDN